MKPRVRILIASLSLCAWLLDACTFSVQVVPTPGATLPATPTASSTPSRLPATETLEPGVVAPFATLTPVAIRLDTLSLLEIFNNIDVPETARALAFSPDGEVLAGTGGDANDFTIHLWYAESGEEIGALEGHRDIVWNLAFSPDGSMLASVSGDGTANIWDWRAGILLQTLQFPNQVGTVNFSPNGETIAVGGLDDPQYLTAAIWIYSTSAWKPLLKIPDYVNITAMAYSPNGRWLVGGGASRNVQVWRTSDGTSLFTLNHPHPSLDVAISVDNTVAATATCSFAVDDDCAEGAVWLWDLNSGKLIQHLRGFPDTVENVIFSADGSLLIAASRDGMVRIYDTATFAVVFEADPPGGNGALALSPDGRFLATGGSNGEVRLWRVVVRP